MNNNEYEKEVAMEEEFLSKNPELKKNRKLAIIYFSISMISAFFGLIFIAYSQTNEKTLYVLLLFGILICLVCIAFLFLGINKAIKKKELINKIIEERIKEKYPNFIYEKSKGIDEEVIEKMGYTRYYNSIKTEDYLAGEIDGIKFESSDVRLIAVGSKSMNARIMTRFFIFDYNKKINGQVFISEKKFHLLVPYGLEKVKFESIAFNEQFSVYSDNENDAFLCITPLFMERLSKLEKEYEDELTILIENNKIYIAYNCDRDTFNQNELEFISIKHIDNLIDEAMIFSDMIKLLGLK